MFEITKNVETFIYTQLKSCKYGDKVILPDGKRGIVISETNELMLLMVKNGESFTYDGQHFSYVNGDTVVQKKVRATEITMSKDTYKKENSNMIKDYKIYKDKDGKDKVVVVKFADGTEERAVCCEEDNFDLERGVEICVLKYLLGDRYRTTISDVMKQIKAIDKEKEAKKKEEAEIAAKKEKAVRKKARRAENLRKKRISEMEEAYFNAMTRAGLNS